MKLVVVLCMVAAALARSHHHHRQKQDTWTKIGQSYFRVIEEQVNWEAAKLNCERFSGQFMIAGSIVGETVGHLAYDTSDEIHQFLKTAHEEGQSKSKLSKHSKFLSTLGTYHFQTDAPICIQSWAISGLILVLNCSSLMEE